MESRFREKFLKDIAFIHHPKILKAIHEAILNAEAAGNLQQIRNIEKMKDAKNAYRIRVGDYRIGFFLEENCIEFTRCLHRKEIYRYFP